MSARARSGTIPNRRRAAPDAAASGDCIRNTRALIEVKVPRPAGRLNGGAGQAAFV